MVYCRCDHFDNSFVCLFVCLFGDVIITVKGWTFFFTYALLTIEECGFISVPHLLWHGESVYNCNFRGPVTLTPVAERLEVEPSLYLFLRLSSVAGGIQTSNLPHEMRTFLPTASPRWCNDKQNISKWRNLR